MFLFDILTFVAVAVICLMLLPSVSMNIITIVAFFCLYSSSHC